MVCRLYLQLFPILIETFFWLGISMSALKILEALKSEYSFVAVRRGQIRGRFYHGRSEFISVWNFQPSVKLR